MRVFLMTDMEGIAGINDIEQMDRQKDTYRNACELLEHSINLAVAACYDNGADLVYYMDGHGGGKNVIPEKIDGRAIACNKDDWQALLREGKIDCLVEIGSHARAGTIGGFLDHTISSREFYYIKCNGVEMSELSLHAILCAKYGVPIVAVLGDEVACRQAKTYIPDIYTGAVKNASCRNQAETYPDADRILVETIGKALANYKNVSLIRYSEPAHIEQAFYRTDFCEKVLSKRGPEVRRVDARTLEKTVAHIAAYADLRI